MLKAPEKQIEQAAITTRINIPVSKEDATTDLQSDLRLQVVLIDIAYTFMLLFNYMNG